MATKTISTHPDQPQGPIRAWHFLAENKRLGYDDNRVVRAGVSYRLKTKNPPLLCRRGMHASIKPLDALDYAPGPIVCRVEISGDIEKDNDKIVGRCRRVLWMSDATNTLHRFACKCSEDALRTANVEDERCWNAIRVKLLWLEGKATDDGLAAARAAARAKQNRRLTSMLNALKPEGVKV